MIRHSRAVYTLFFVVYVLLCISCSEESRSLSDESQVQIDTVFAVDSIGVFEGDSTQMFGDITSVVPLPNDKLAVLDRVKAMVSIFGANGDLLDAFGRRGTGPSEFQGPIHMAMMTDGRYIIQDWMDGTFEIFSPEGEYSHSISLEYAIDPIAFSILPSDDSTFVTYVFTREIYGQHVNQKWGIVRSRISNGETVTCYFDNNQDISSENLDFLSGYKVVTTDALGRVYISDCDSGEYRIDILSAGGDSLYTIERQLITSRVTEDDIGYIIPTVFVGNDPRHPRDIPGRYPEYRPFVGQMDVDSLGNLWVRQGTTDEHIWDIYSPNHDYTGSVFLDGVPTDATVELHMNEHGVAATLVAPEDYPRVYIIGDRRQE